jgi:uncharacterized protein with von Willebrand factor type A (vWA) domain
MSDHLGQIVAELRVVGVPVSLSEYIDAANALKLVGDINTEMIRTVLTLSLVKQIDHLVALTTILDIYFSSTFADNGRKYGLAELNSVEFSSALRMALRRFDKLTLEALAVEAVRRHAAIIPGRPVGGTYYVARTLRQLALSDITAELNAAADTGETSRPSLPIDTIILKHQNQERLAFFRHAVDAEVRRQLVIDRGTQALAQARRKPLTEQVEFLNASTEEFTAIERALIPMARRLARRIRHKQRCDGDLNIRQTLRRAMAYGGIPAELVFQKTLHRPPKLLVIADVSASVASFVQFTLALVRQLVQNFPQKRIFAFLDDIADVTSLFEKRREIGDAIKALAERQDLVRLDGHSDYGHAFKSFHAQWGKTISRATVILILGDGRNNHRAPELGALAAIRQRAGALYWLNPEPRENWGLGDSDAARFAPHCTAMLECRNLAQLNRFMDHLSAPGGARM